MTQIHDLTVAELAAAIREGQLSPIEITDHYLDRIDRLGDQVGAFYTVTHDLARQEAAAAEKAAAQARRDERPALASAGDAGPVVFASGPVSESTRHSVIEPRLATL